MKLSISPETIKMNSTIFALLENTKADADLQQSHLFLDPEEIICCNATDEIANCFERMSLLQATGYYLVGFASYQLGYCFEERFSELAKTSDFPLLYFIAFKTNRLLNQNDVTKFLAELNNESDLPDLIYDLKLNISKEQYTTQLNKIKSYIKEGDTYQVNYTAKYHFNYQGNPANLYSRLRQRQPVEYSAFLNFPDYKILSLSPELFFKKHGSQIISKPMKGTAARGKNLAEDAEIIRFLKSDPKTLAENVMIVDLLRNDLGRLAKTGTVKVPSLFEVESYLTLFQMTSTITAEINPAITLHEIFKAIFPCGSVTGAPKIRTMEIINELELEPRNLYTGALGFVLPTNDICMNVPIRTIILDNNHCGELGIGSGIVDDSDIDCEYDEIILKAKFVTEIDFGFELLETLRYSAKEKNYLRLAMHIERLSHSAQFFNFYLSTAEILSALMTLKDKFADKLDYKIRILVNKFGKFKIEYSEAINILTTAKYKITISNELINSDNILLQHKTTAASTRQFYNDQYNLAKQQYNIDELIFRNQLNEITEGSKTNIFLEKQGVLYTPPLHCGLLPGIMRQTVLNDKKFTVIEKILYPNDLLSADKILLTNTVIGMVEAELIGITDGTNY